MYSQLLRVSPMIQSACQHFQKSVNHGHIRSVPFFDFRASMLGSTLTQMERKKAWQWFSTPQVTVVVHCFLFLQNQLHCLIHINESATYSHKQGRGRSPSWSCPSTTPAWSRWPRSPRCNKFPFSKFEMKSRNINLGRWQMDRLRSEKRLQHRPSNWLGSSLAYILCYRVIIMKTKWAFLCKIMFILFFHQQNGILEQMIRI